MTGEEELYEAKDFEAFWTAYVGLHRHPLTRALHCVATTCAMACIACGFATRNVLWFAIAPLVDYAIAQTSHRVVERNRTQPYRNPPWHIRAELKLWFLTLTGRMGAEVARNAPAQRLP
jgi:hypothetical protein